MTSGREKQDQEAHEETEDEDVDREDKEEEATGPTLQVEIQQNTEDGPEIDDDEEEQVESPTAETQEETPKRKKGRSRDDQEEQDLLSSRISEEVAIITDPKVIAQMEIIKNQKPQSELELALAAVLENKEQHIQKLVNEIFKLKGFISKRKQTYKRKRKDEGAPTRALSAYNIFIQDRFAKLAKENDAALKSADTNIQMQRVPPANLVASTGNAWKGLPPEEKAKYEERAKADRKRYEEQMAKYQPPDKQSNRKRNKTGYNMFFSAHVLRLKQSELGVPSERGSVARLVGNAWKALTAEEKQYYEREADKHNGMNPVDPGKDGDDEEDEEIKRQQQQDPYAAHHGQYPGHDAVGYSHVHAGMHATATQHDPRHHPYYYPPTHGYYDYSGHHHPQHSRSSRHQYQYSAQPGYEYK